MKTIVFLVEQIVNMGPENVVLDICRCIDKSKYTPIVFSLRNEDAEKTIEHKFRELGVEIVHFELGMLDQELHTKKVARIVKKAYQEKGGYILHAHTYHPQLVASLINGINTVATIHNISGEDFVMKKGAIMGRYMKWRFDRTLSKMNCAVAISEYMMEYYSGMCNKIVKIPNGVSFKKDDMFDKEAFKHSIGIGTDKTVVVVTGSISDRKNVAYLVSEIKLSKKDFVCFIVGDGDKLEECQRIVGGDSRFKFEGFRNNVADYLSIADFYISASKSEGLPLSVLEAINMGVPSLLSDIPPHKEIVANMNTKGVSCYHLAKGELSVSFDNALSNKYDHNAILRRANEVYSAQVMTKKYEKIYEQI